MTPSPSPETEIADPADLDLPELLRIMDVASALRRERQRAETELDREQVEARLRDRLREAATATGERVTDAEIDAAIRQYFGTKHEFEPPERGLKTFLAHVYIRRVPVFVALLVLALLAALVWWLFFAASGPFSEEGRKARARSEAARVLEAEESALRAIEPTPAAKARIDALRTRIAAARSAGDPKAMSALGRELGSLRDVLDDEYTVRVVSTTGRARSAFRQDYTDGSGTRVSGYFLVVGAYGPGDARLKLPIRDANDNRTRRVDSWAEQIPQGVYERLKADKLADGVLDEAVFARKQKGALELEVVMKAQSGSAVERGRQLTRWDD